jgi:hypothetical protein
VGGRARCGRSCDASGAGAPDRRVSPGCRSARPPADRVSRDAPRPIRSRSCAPRGGPSR